MSTETLNSSHNGGITLTTLTGSGDYNAPFTITALGTIQANGAVGVYSAAPAYIRNAGLITGASPFGIHLADGGTLANAGTISAGVAGVDVNNAAGTVSNAGTIIGTGNWGVYLDAGSVSNTGMIKGNLLGVYGESQAVTVVNAGTITGKTDAVLLKNAAGDRVVAAAGAVFIGAVNVSGVGSTLEFAGAGGTVASIGGQFMAFHTLAFDPGSAWTISGSTMGLGASLSINGFGAGDAIDLTGFAATAEIFASNALTLSNGGVFETLDIAGGFSSASFVLESDHAGGTVIDVTCFCAGTRILTPAGERLVEVLRPGDLVITAAAKTRPIMWVGRERIDILRHPEPELVRPICIRAGALGGGVPERDLRVSPHHGVLVGGERVEAVSLVDGGGVFQEQGGAEVVYFHVELESHDVLLAEGAPCESFNDTGTRLRARNFFAELRAAMT